MNIVSKPFSTVVELMSFQDKVKHYFLDNGSTEIIFNDIGYVKVNNFGEKLYGIWNVAQNCALAQEQEWSGIIKNHFDHLLTIPAETEDYILRTKDFSNVKEDLRLQLYPTKYLEGIDEKLVHELVSRIDIPGTLSMVVIDLPSALQSIRRSDLESWNVT